MVDEVHERKVNGDVLLGLLKKIIRKRQDLRIIISSASMNVNLYKHFFQDVEYADPRDSLKPYTILTVQGHQYPVDILLSCESWLTCSFTSTPVPNYVDTAAAVGIVGDYHS